MPFPFLFLSLLLCRAVQLCGQLQLQVIIVQRLQLCDFNCMLNFAARLNIGLTFTHNIYRIAQNSGRGKLWRIWRNNCHSPIFFTQPNSRFTIITNGSYCKFVNVFLAKTLKQSIRQSFTLSKFCAIR